MVTGKCRIASTKGRSELCPCCPPCPPCIFLAVGESTATSTLLSVRLSRGRFGVFCWGLLWPEEQSEVVAEFGDVIKTLTVQEKPCGTEWKGSQLG